MYILDSWDEAILSGGSQAWHEISNSWANNLPESLAGISEERYKLFNDVCAELRPLAKELAHEKTRPVVEQYGLPPKFTHIVAWDILYTCLEAEYADLIPPAFFVNLAYWYTQGHFPCGWLGDCPDGILILY